MVTAEYDKIYIGNIPVDGDQVSETFSITLETDCLILWVQLVVGGMKDSLEWYATFHWILNLHFSCLTVSYLLTLLCITLMFLATVHYSCKLWFTLDVNLFRTEHFSPACLHSNMAPVTVIREKQDPHKGKELKLLRAWAEFCIANFYFSTCHWSHLALSD